MRAFFFATLALPGLAAATVNYRIQPQPTNGTLAVAVTLNDPKESETFRIPAWCPGFYFIQHYERKMSDVRALDEDGRTLTVKSIDSRSWQVMRGSAKTITFRYRVLGDDPGLGFFGTRVQSDKAFVNGPSALVYVDGRKTEATHLEVKNPAGWEVATAMTPDGLGGYTGEGYDELVDHPVQLGIFTRRSFQIGDVPYDVVFVAPGNRQQCDVDAETDRLRRVAEPAVRLFGGSPFKRYVFFLHLAVGTFNGGLEHRASTVMAVPNVAKLGIDDLAAHEFFHAWNVKQIRPIELGPFDYTKAVRTPSLWFAEGVTDYYSKLMVYRSGLWDSRRLLVELTDNIAELQSSSTRRSVSLGEASLRAWENGGFGVGDLSYYTKGLVAGFILDATIRGATNGSKSLDDVMRALYANHRLPKPGYTEADLIAALSSAAGKDLTILFQRLVHSKEEVPYDELAKIGLGLATPNSSVAPLTLAIRTDGRLTADVDPFLLGDQILKVEALEGDKLRVTAHRGDVTFAQTIPRDSISADQFMLIPRILEIDRPSWKRLAEWLDRSVSVEQKD